MFRTGTVFLPVLVKTPSNPPTPVPPEVRPTPSTRLQPSDRSTTLARYLLLTRSLSHPLHTRESWHFIVVRYRRIDYTTVHEKTQSLVLTVFRDWTVSNIRTPPPDCYCIIYLYMSYSFYSRYLFFLCLFVPCPTSPDPTKRSIVSYQSHPTVFYLSPSVKGKRKETCVPVQRVGRRGNLTLLAGPQTTYLTSTFITYGAGPDPQYRTHKKEEGGGTGADSV